LPSTWQELLLEEDRSLARRQEEIAKEERELEKKKKLSPDEQHRHDERWRALEDQRKELYAESLKNRAQGLQEIARKVSKDRIRGIFDKDILVSENERVLLLVDGSIQQILGPGVHRVGGLARDIKTGAILSKIKLGRAESVDVVFVNLSDIDIKWGFGPELRTQDEFKLGAHGIIRLKINEPDVAKLFANMMDMTAQRIRVEDLKNRIGLELLGSVIAPVTKSYKIDDLWANKMVVEDCYNGIETEMRKTLSRWGFEIVQFTIDYNFPEGWLKQKEEAVARPIRLAADLARNIDEKIKYPNEYWRAEFVAERDKELLKKQFAHESELLDKRYGQESDLLDTKQRQEQNLLALQQQHDANLHEMQAGQEERLLGKKQQSELKQQDLDLMQRDQDLRVLGKKHEGELKQQDITIQDYEFTLQQKREDFDLTAKQKRHDFEITTDRSDFEQGIDYKRQLDKLNLDRETGVVQLKQTTDTAAVQLAELQKEGDSRRRVEMVRAEHEGRAQTLQVLASSGSADAIAKGLEADTLRRIAELGGTAEAADAIKSKYTLETHEDAEAKAYKQAIDLFNVAKPPPPPGPPGVVRSKKDEEDDERDIDEVDVTVKEAPPPVPAPAPVSASIPPLSAPSAKAVAAVQNPTVPSYSVRTSSGKNCPSCNTLNLEVAKYCTVCGEKL